MKFKTHFFLIACLLILNSCKSKSEKTEVSTEETTQDEKTITATDVGKLKYTDYILSSDSQNTTLEWQKYQELQSQVSFLKKGDLSFFTNEKDTLKVFFQALKTEIPQKINTNIVQSRITVLETQTLKFNSLLKLDNISKNEKLKGIKDILISMSNLNLQINKKLELDANNINKPD